MSPLLVLISLNKQNIVIKRLLRAQTLTQLGTLHLLFLREDSLLTVIESLPVHVPLLMLKLLVNRLMVTCVLLDMQKVIQLLLFLCHLREYLRRRLARFNA